ncbi:MAG: hypothetical protein OXL68_00360 [Paracoccaceae bacterium]|nr:hypothetical protein [Paracoccaceae bacterium]
MVASIGKIASPAQGMGYFERDGYYAKDDGAYREASAWADFKPRCYRKSRRQAFRLRMAAGKGSPIMLPLNKSVVSESGSVNASRRAERAPPGLHWGGRSAADQRANRRNAFRTCG